MGRTDTPGSEQGRLTGSLEELRESEARFWFITEMAPVGIAQVDIDGRFLFANRRLGELLGHAPSELQ